MTEAARQVIVPQAEKLQAQAETIGRQGAELERAATTVAALDDALTAHRRRVTVGAITFTACTIIAVMVAIMAITGWPRP